MRILTVVLAVLLATPTLAGEFGDCSERVKAEWWDDGRTMTLLADYTYVDGHGTRWVAPAGRTVDGASIPPFLWSLVGGPYAGPYRDASVPHDIECKDQQNDWQVVHQMFYDLMRCSEVSETLAKIMYGAVYHCGPRWGPEQGVRWFPCHEDFGKQLVRRLRRYFSRNAVVSLDQVAEVREEDLQGISGEGPLELLGDLPDGIEVRETLDGFTISLIDYASGDVSLSQRAETVLASATPLLRSYAKSVVVEGHADSVGQNDLNMAIASARAHDVGDKLLLQGLEPASLEVISWGEERPFAVEGTPEAQALNRRVEIVVKEIE